MKDDLISRQDAIDAICTWDKFGVDERGRVVRWYEGLEPYVHLRDVVFAIEKLPSAESTQKTGNWTVHTEIKNAYGGIYIECSECGECYIVQHLDDEIFCRTCGSKNGR